MWMARRDIGMGEKERRKEKRYRQTDRHREGEIETKIERKKEG